MQTHYTHVIWDFNGTILDDVDLCISCVNQMLQDRELPIIPNAQYYRNIMRFPIIDYYRDLGFDFEREDYYTKLAPEWVALYMKNEATCPMMEGVLETLQAIAQRGIPQIILSASNRDQLMMQLERLGIVDYFDEILGLDNIFARSKTILAKLWRERHPDAIPLCVGDTDHDVETADELGATCVLYTGGHQGRERLSLCGKTLIDHIPDLLNCLA